MRNGRLVLILGLILMVCVGEAAAASTVKIGPLLPLTGPLAMAGQRVKNVMSFAAEEINAQGGIKSMGGAKLELVFGDNQSKPDVAISEVERLVEKEKVAILTESWQSFITLPASQTAERLKTVYYAPVSYADNITERGFRYTFQQEPKASDVARDWVRFLNHANQNLGTKISKVGVIFENTDMGQSNAAAAKKFLAESKYNQVADLSYPARASDLTSTIAKLKAADPEVVLQASYLGDAILIAKTADRLGLRVPFIDNGNINDPSYIKNIGALAEGKLGINMWNKDVPGGQKLFDKYRARYGEDISGIYVLCYQAIWVFKEALEKAGSADREAIRDALATINIPGSKLYLPYEKIQFNEKGYNVGGGYIITQVQNGEWFTVWPGKFASKKAVLK
jgi:branched-chain amino acid transport system substrate-binding protein